MGGIRRNDLVTRFGLQEAAATRDISLYKSLAANNIQYDAKAKTYLIGNNFHPLFNYDTERVLTWLTQGIGDNAEPQPKTWIISDGPALLAKPDLNTLSAVTRAMYLGCPLSMQYHSISSGLTQREIVPFALIDTGLRWHVRAFDRRRSEFLDFVLGRIHHAQTLSGPVADKEKSDHDLQWHRIIQLELVPHPVNVHYPATIEAEYGMAGGVLKIDTRAAMVGYLLRRWNVDCSEDHRLKGGEYQLWLRNRHALDRVSNLILAPGYAPAERKDSTC